MIENDGVIILVDPYLSNGVAKVQPQNYRRVAVDEKFLEIKPDIIVLTHNHLDHTDPYTLCHYLTENSSVTVLASKNALQQAKKFGGNNNYVLFNNGSTWTEKGVTFRAVYAEHSDDFSVGVIFTIEGKNYYHTGDTLYSEKVFDSLPDEEIEVVFLPINGKGNNMSMVDAKSFAIRLNANKVVPIHVGMFDEISPNDFELPNKVTPQIYKKINL